MSKIILITGATSGFGKAIAWKFAQEGYDICITGRRADRLEALKQEIATACGVNVVTLQFDVRKRYEVEQAISRLKEQVTHIDVLVNNAGLASGLNTIDEGDPDDWELMIDTNIKGLLYVTRQVTPMMKERAAGHIINIGSTAGKIVYKNGNVYCATKFAVDALSQALRIELLQYSIKVTNINPGMAETEFSLVRFKGDEERAKNMYVGVNALKAQDIADIAWFCASQPPHVCINDINVTCLTQANSVYNIKETERKKPNA